MTSGYLPVLIHLAIAIVLATALLVLHRLAGGRRPRVWPIGDARERIPIRYYLVAMLFILFDIEIVFVYPWAVLVRELGKAGLVEMFTFLAVLGVGYVYLLRRRALEWE
jgi:NADH-quinone oxidoreductase subunit A